MPLDPAGTSLTTAKEIFVTPGLQTFSDQIDSLNPADYYRLCFAGRSSLSLSLNGLTANANLQLLSSSGAVLQTSDNGDNLAESINTVLAAGTYYLRVSSSSGSASTSYNLRFNTGSGQVDLLWRDYTSGANAIWQMTNTSNTGIQSGASLTSVGGNWRMEAAADFNGDNQVDIFWRDYASGTNAIWFMGSDRTTILGGSSLLSLSPNWTVGGIADFNGDNRPDILWRDSATGANVVWFMGGTHNTTILGGSMLTSVGSNWSIGGLADFNGDNRPDILWRDSATGANAVWFMGSTNSTTIVGGSALTSVGLGWTLSGVTDFNGDSRPDILWRDYATGTNVVWFMGGTNSTTIVGGSTLAPVATTWKPLPYTRYLETPSDGVGNTLTTALNLGILNSSGSFSDAVGSSDSNDYYQFNLTSQGTVTLGLSELTADANLQLFNSGGTLLQTSNLSGSSSESLSRTLDAGTYYIRVYQGSGDTSYRLTATNGAGTLPTVSVTVTDSSAAETVTGQLANPGQFTLTRSGNTATTLTVNYTIGGTASSGIDYGDLGSSITFQPGQSSLVLSVNVLDDAILETNETVILTLVGGATYNLGNSTGSVTIFDNDLPLVSLSATDSTAAETSVGQISNPGQFTFSRSGSTANALTVTYTIGGTATNGLDYNTLSGNVTFLAGQSIATLPITIVDDGLIEGTETLILTLVSGSTYSLGNSSGTVTITDNDLPTVNLSVTDASAAETTTGQTSNPGQFTFSRNGSTASTLTVNYTIGGTATNGTDYQWLSGNITFQTGQATVTLPITVLEDALFESNETVVLTLLSSSSYSLGSTMGTVTIADNDLPTVSLSATDSSAAETLTSQTANPGQFTLTRTGSTASALTVYYTIGGSATNGVDYSTLSSSATFLAGQSSLNLNLSILNDALIEGNETVILTLSSSSAYSLGSNSTAIVTIADDDFIDLRGAFFDATPEPINAGSSITVNFQVQNLGTVVAGAFQVAFYLSGDNTISTADRLLGSYNFSSLAASTTTTTLTTSFGLPGATDAFWSGSKTYYIGIIVDAANAIAESLETNNSNRGIALDLDDVLINLPAPAEPGNTLSSAELLSSVSFTRSEQVSSLDLHDFYRFTIGQSGIFTATLSGLSGDADVRLIQDSNSNGLIDQGEIIAWQWERSTVSESIRRFLNAGTYYLQVMSYNNQTASYSVTTGFTAAASDDQKFSIQVNLGQGLSGLTAASLNAIQEAARYWESVITHRSAITNSNTLVISVTGEALTYSDGSANTSTLAQAGPYLGTTDGRTNVYITSGEATINTYMLSQMNSNTSYLRDIMIHEFGHVLGLGTLWEQTEWHWSNGAITYSGTNLIDRTTVTYNANTYAGWVYGELKNTYVQTAIPLTSGVGGGSDFSHWSESVFNSELMTYQAEYPGTAMPLSQMTIASLRDIGWNVNYGAAATYNLG